MSGCQDPAAEKTSKSCIELTPGDELRTNHNLHPFVTTAYIMSVKSMGMIPRYFEVKYIK